MSESDIGQNITFFVYDSRHKQAVEPIAEEASNRGYFVSFSDEVYEPAEIGVYTQHTGGILPFNAKLSVAMFHGIDQGYMPDLWPKMENWRYVDIGFLPSETAAETWRSCSHVPHARPKRGVFKVGWPKSDFVFKPGFEEQVQQYKERYGIGDGTTVLYAPSYESGGKISEFVEKVDGAADNLLVKHGPFDSGQYLEADTTLLDLYEKHSSKITPLDTDDNIFLGLGAADVLVSDESSVLLEASFTETVPVSVVDWPTATESSPEDKELVPDLAVQTTSINLSDEISEIISSISSQKRKLVNARERHLENPGAGAQSVMDLIDDVRLNDQPDIDKLNPRKKNNLEYVYLLSLMQIERLESKIRWKIIENLSDSKKEFLRKHDIDDLYYRFSKLVGQYRS